MRTVFHTLVTTAACLCWAGMAAAQSLAGVTIGAPPPANIAFDTPRDTGQPYPGTNSTIWLYDRRAANNVTLNLSTIGENGPVDYIAVGANAPTGNGTPLPSGISDLMIYGTTRSEFITRYGRGLVNDEFGNTNTPEAGYLAYQVDGAFLFAYFAIPRTSSGTPASADLNDATVQNITMISENRAIIGGYLADGQTIADVPAISFP